MADKSVKQQVARLLKGLKEAGASQEVQDAAKKWLETIPQPKKK